MNLSDLPVRTVCPLGMSACREVKDGSIHQCAWVVNIVGKNPQSDDVVDEWRCSMAWTPILLVENAQTNRGQTQAIESMRNEMTQGQQTFSSIMLTLAENKQKRFIE